MNDAQMKLDALTLASRWCREGDALLPMAKEIYGWLSGDKFPVVIANGGVAASTNAPKRRGRPPKIKVESKHKDIFAIPKRKYTKKNTAYWGK